ncbi:MAG: hypothetical protein ACRDZ5_08045, partial [Acidimicrobiales bacterium]
HGTWSLIAYMQYLKALYFVGADPERIAGRYREGPPWTRRHRTHRLTRAEGPDAYGPLLVATGDLAADGPGGILSPPRGSRRP